MTLVIAAVTLVFVLVVATRRAIPPTARFILSGMMLLLGLLVILELPKEKKERPVVVLDVNRVRDPNREELTLPAGTLWDSTEPTGPSRPRSFVTVGEHVYFAALHETIDESTTTGSRSWVIVDYPDPSSSTGIGDAATVVEDWQAPSENEEPLHLTAHAGSLYFWAPGDPGELRRLSGTDWFVVEPAAEGDENQIEAVRGLASDSTDLWAIGPAVGEAELTLWRVLAADQYERAETSELTAEPEQSILFEDCDNDGEGFLALGVGDLPGDLELSAIRTADASPAWTDPATAVEVSETAAARGCLFLAGRTETTSVKTLLRFDPDGLTAATGAGSDPRALLARGPRVWYGALEGETWLPWVATAETANAIELAQTQTLSGNFHFARGTVGNIWFANEHGAVSLWRIDITNTAADRRLVQSVGDVSAFAVIGSSSGDRPVLLTDSDGVFWCLDAGSTQLQQSPIVDYAGSPMPVGPFHVLDDHVLFAAEHLVAGLEPFHFPVEVDIE